MIRKLSALFIAVSLATAAFAAAPFEMTRGDIKLVLYPDSGSFSLYKLSDIGKNRYEPLFEDRDASATSWFSVSVNGRIFKLAPKMGKPVAFAETKDGAKFVFTLSDDFQVEQEFSFTTTALSGASPMVLIETRIENTSGKSGSFALKAMLDTSLGERAASHFRTDIRNRISAETRFVSGVDRDSWILSKNGTLALAFLRAGPDITAPDTVYIANWDRLNSMTWLPDFAEGRSFNTIYSINDSAVLVVWHDKELRAKEKMSGRMMLGSWNGSAGESAAKLAVDPKKIRMGDYREAAIKDLLDRIAAIESDPDSVSEEELIRLNAELDSMLGQTGD